MSDRIEDATALSSSFRLRAQVALAADARLWTTLAYTAVALGCLLRVLRWIDNPALWLDEALLAINLTEKSFSDLFGSLQFLQSAPPGFLVVEKAAETLLGDAEWSLRLFSLLASLASVFLFAYVARRVLAPPAAVLAVGLFAVSEPLVEHAAEVKPYSVDVTVAVLLTALYLWVDKAPHERAGRRLGVLAGAGLLALWVSFPAVFTLAGVLVALGVRALQTRSRSAIVRTAIFGVASLATFGAVYAVASSTVSQITARIFGTGNEALAVSRLHTVRDAWSIFVNPGGFANGTNGLAVLLACLGMVAFFRRDRLHLLALFTVPLVLAALADFVDRYPLGGRWSLFLVPCMLVLVTRGGQALVEWSRRPILVATGLVVFVLASPLALGVYHVTELPAREDIKPLLHRVVAEWEDGDALYVHENSQYALRYYSRCEECSISGRDFPWPTRVARESPPGLQIARALESVPPQVVVGETLPGESPVDELELLPRAGRVWLLFSHVDSHTGLNDESLILRTLEGRGELVERVRARGARLYLFELDR